MVLLRNAFFEGFAPTLAEFARDFIPLPDIKTVGRDTGTLDPVQKLLGLVENVKDDLDRGFFLQDGSEQFFVGVKNIEFVFEARKAGNPM